jgi:hypothetical protein
LVCEWSTARGRMLVTELDENESPISEFSSPFELGCYSSQYAFVEGKYYFLSRKTMENSVLSIDINTKVIQHEIDNYRDAADPL